MQRPGHRLGGFLTVMEVEGVRHRARLREDGVPQGTVRRWLRKGVMSSEQPWYITEAAPPGIAPVLRLGVRPTCLDGASLHGLWTPPHPGAHVFRPRQLHAGEELRGARACTPCGADPGR